MNKKTVQEILAYLPGLQDHADKFAYYGEPADAFYDEYDAEDEHGNHLVISQECNEMCETIGADLQNGESWEDWFSQQNKQPENLQKDFKPEDMDEQAICAALLYLIDSLSFNDDLIDALKSGYFTRLIEQLSRISAEEEIN